MTLGQAICVSFLPLDLKKKSTSSATVSTLQYALCKAKHSSHLAMGTRTGAQDSSKVDVLTELINIKF